MKFKLETYLSSQPSSSSWGNVLFNDGDFDVRPLLGNLIGAGKASRPSSNDDNIGLSKGIHVLEVAGGHGAGNSGLADGRE